MPGVAVSTRNYSSWNGKYSGRDFIRHFCCFSIPVRSVNNVVKIEVIVIIKPIHDPRLKRWVSMYLRRSGKLHIQLRF